MDRFGSQGIVTLNYSRNRRHSGQHQDYREATQQLRSDAQSHEVVPPQEDVSRATA